MFFCCRHLRCKSVAGGALLATFGPFDVMQCAAHSGVVEVHISSRSNKLNLLDDAFVRNLPLTMAFVNEDLNATARVAILVGGDGKPFSAGLDIKSAMKTFFKDVSTVDKAKVVVGSALGVPTKIRDGGDGMPAMRNQMMHRVIREFQDSISSVARCRVPVIAAINSHCLGGAISLATACDFRFCTEDSMFCVKEVKIGINPDIGTLQRLYPLVGQGRARELTFTARTFGAADAKAYGLVEEVFADKESMLRGARAAAIEVASNSPLAVQGAKHVMNVQSERMAQESLDYVRLWNSAFIKSNDLVAAGTAFASKSDAQFTDFVVDATSPPINPTKRT